MSLLYPKEVEVNGKTFILSKFPAVAGREIVTQYPLTAIPKIGEYKSNETIMLKLMGYVAVKAGDGMIRLTTRELIDNHVPDWETLAQLEIGMIEYNCSFFGDGRASAFFEGFALKVKAFLTQTLTDSLAQSSQAGKQPSES